MDELGKLVARYYVIKTDGIFSKNQRFLHIHEKGLEFRPLNYSKPSKANDAYLFKDLSEIVISAHNDKDLMVKAGKHSFSLSCMDRLNLLIDIFFYKDLWDLSNVPNAAAKIPSFKGHRQVDLGDPSSKIPVTVQVLKSVILVEHTEDSSEEESKKRKKHCIRYNEIDCIIPTASGILIGTKMEYEKYVFANEAAAAFIDLLKEIPKKTLSTLLTFKPEQSYAEEKLMEQDEFAIPLKVYKYAGLEKSLRLHVNANSFLEEDVKDNRVVLKYLLTSLSCIKVIRKKAHNTVVLCQAHGMQYKYHMKPHEADYLLANILHAIQTKDDTDFYVPLVLLESADFAMKIHALIGEMDSSFEGSLKKEIEEVAAHGDILDTKVRNSILDAALNANFKSLGFDHKFVALLFALLADLAQILLKLENDPTAISSYEEYLAFLPKPEPESMPMDTGKLMYEVSQRIPPLLAVIRNCLFWRSSLPDIPTFQKQIEVLLSLSGSKNSVVSIMSALTLRSLLKLNKSSDKRLETPSKKWVIRELDIINKLAVTIRPFMEKSAKDFLDKLKNSDTIHRSPYLQLYGLMNIFEVIFMEKREAHSEDLLYIVSSILDQDHVLNLIEQLSMYNSKPIIYQSSLISAQSLLLLYNTNDKEQLLRRQHKILMYTTILLWNIRLLLSYSSIRQQRLSASVAALVVTGNPECSALINRMFPKSLLKKVDASKTFSEWKPENWKELFVLLQNNYRTATEQWNEECRQELRDKLKDTALDYFAVKYGGGNEKLRWNYEEFEIAYKCLEEKCKVGKYYLKDLLKRNEGLFLYFTEIIMKPVQFWNKLVNKFLAITNVSEQQLVLTVLNLVYQDHFQMIRDMKILPYFVHLLENECAKHLHTFVLELIYTSLKIKYPEVVTANYQMIIRANGLENLINLLSRTYVPPVKDPCKSERIRKGGLIIRILDLMLKKMDKKYITAPQVTPFNRSVYPVSLVRAFCEQHRHLSTIVQVLLVGNTELRKKTMKFIGNYFVSPGGDRKLKTTGIVDLLVNALDDKTGVEAFALLYKIQGISEDYNDDIDFDVFSIADHELINTNDKIKNSIFLRYFPVPFVKYLTEDSNREQVMKIYLEDSIQEPALIWSKEMRELLQNTLADHLNEFKEQLEKFVGNKAPGFRKVSNMPVYSKRFTKVMKYPQIEKEIRCVEYYLRIWNQDKGKMENVQQVVFFNNLESTFNEVTARFPELNLDDFQIVLRSYTLAYANFNKKGTFPCFNMLIKVLEKVCESVHDVPNQSHLKNMLKFIYRTIRIGMNFNAFEEHKGTAQTMSVLISWLRSIEAEKYQGLNAVTLSGLRWGLAIINEAIEKSSTLWNSIEYSSRETLIKKLFELVCHLQHEAFETECVIPKKEEPKVRHQLSTLLRVPKYRKSGEIDYQAQITSAILKTIGDSYTYSSVFLTIEMVYCLLINLSQSTNSQKELLLTGAYILGFSHFTMQSNNFGSLKQIFALDYLKALGLVTFRHLAAFATEIKTALPEPLNTFEEVIKHLMCDHFLRFILYNVEVVAHRIKEPSLKTVTEILGQALEKFDKDIEHPECLWNDSTRTEFRAAIKAQLDFYHSNAQASEDNFADILKNLEYTAYKDEIRVGEVFIRLLNKDPYMNFTHPNTTIKEIIQELGKIDTRGGDESLLARTNSLLEALNNIILYQKGLDLNIISKGNIKILCSYLDPLVDKIPKERKAIYNHVLGVLLELTKDTKQTGNVAKTVEFLRVAVHAAISLKNEYILRRVMMCLENVVAQHDCDATIVESGLFIVFIRNAISRDIEKRYRLPFFSFTQTILARNGIDHVGISAVQMMVPRQLLEKFVEEQNKTPEEWIGYLDGERRELTFIWNNELYAKVIEGLQAEVAKIEVKVDEEEAKWERPVDSYIAAQLNKGEIVITDTVLTVYLKCPYVKIKKPYAKFLDSLCENILLNTSLLSAYRKSCLNKKPEDPLEDNQELVANHQNGLLCMLTTLLLNYEQIYKNHFNLNKLPSEQMSRKRKENGCSAFVSETVREIIVLGMQPTNSTEVLITLLEIVYLLCDQKEILDKEDLLASVNAITQCLVGMISANENIEKTFEVLSFCVLLKVLDRIPVTKGKDKILEMIRSNNNLLDKLKLMHAFKPHLKFYTEQFIWKVCQFPLYYKFFANELKYELGPDARIERIVKTKYEPLDKVWRKSPAKLEECKVYENTMLLEDFDVAQVNANVLPLISKEVFVQDKFEAAFKYMYEHYGSEWNKSKLQIPLP